MNQCATYSANSLRFDAVEQAQQQLQHQQQLSIPTWEQLTNQSSHKNVSSFHCKTLGFVWTSWSAIGHRTSSCCILCCRNSYFNARTRFIYLLLKLIELSFIKIFSFPIRKLSFSSWELFEPFAANVACWQLLCFKQTDHIYDAFQIIHKWFRT